MTVWSSVAPYFPVETAEGGRGRLSHRKTTTRHQCLRHKDTSEAFVFPVGRYNFVSGKLADDRHGLYINVQRHTHTPMKGQKVHLNFQRSGPEMFTQVTSLVHSNLPKFNNSALAMLSLIVKSGL